MMGRRTGTTYGQKGGQGPNTGKKSRKFVCQHPAGGEPQIKRVFDLPTDAEPVSIWYQAKVNDQWHLNTVLDGRSLPAWANHYTISGAEEMV